MGDPWGSLGHPSGVVRGHRGVLGGRQGSQGGSWGVSGVPFGALFGLVWQCEIIEKPLFFIAFSQCGVPGGASERALGPSGGRGEGPWGPGGRQRGPRGSQWSPRGGLGRLGEPSGGADAPNAHICEGFKGLRGGVPNQVRVKADRDEAPGGNGGA